MIPARQLVQALERESQQLSDEFLLSPTLRKALRTAASSLLFNMEGAKQVERLAIKDGRKKKNYARTNRIDQDPNDRTSLLTPPVTDPESRGSRGGGSDPEYKSWIENGKICYEVQEIEVSVLGTPLRSIQHLVLSSEILSKPLGITMGFSGCILREFEATTVQDTQYEFFEKSSFGSRIARLICFDKKLDLTQEGAVDVVTSKPNSTVRGFANAFGSLRVKARTVVWQGPIPKDNKGTTYDLLLQTINKWNGIAFRNIDERSRVTVNLMSQATRVAINTVSVSSDMMLEVYAHFVKPMDTEYRLMGWLKDGDGPPANDEDESDENDSEDDSDSDSDGDGHNGNDSSNKRRKTHRSGKHSGKRGRDVSKETGGQQHTLIQSG